MMEYITGEKRVVNGVEFLHAYAPDVMRSMGCAVSSASKNLFGGYIVMYDDMYSDMPDPCKDAALLHEIGHIVRGHLDKMPNSQVLYIVLRQLGVYTYMELEADDYAAENSSDSEVILYLEWMMNSLRCNPLSRYEFRRRIFRRRVKILKSKYVHKRR